MTPRDVEIVRARLTSTAVLAARISAHLEDLHGLAFERAVTGTTQKVKQSSTPDLGNVGDVHARELWRRLANHTRLVETTLQALDWAVGNLIAAGPSPMQTRGSAVSPADFAHQIRNQARRRQNGDYTPTRLEEQPGYPGGGGA